MKPDVNRLIQGLEKQYGTGIRRQLQQYLNQQSYPYPEGCVPLPALMFPTWLDPIRQVRVQVRHGRVYETYYGPTQDYQGEEG